MARRRPITKEMPDAVREAVDRTVQATIGSAQLGRGRAQEAVDELVRGAEASAGAVRERVRGAFEAGRPATSEDLRELRSELRQVSRRLAAIERLLEDGDAGDRGAGRAGGGAGRAGAGAAAGDTRRAGAGRAAAGGTSGRSRRSGGARGSS